MRLFKAKGKDTPRSDPPSRDERIGVAAGGFQDDRDRETPMPQLGSDEQLGRPTKASKGGLFGGGRKGEPGAKGLPFKLGRKPSDNNAAGNQQQQPAQRTVQPSNRPSAPPSIRDVIGRFCGMPDEDWSFAFDLADRLSTSEAASRDASEALRQELKHGAPQAQERAVRLLVVLMRNSSDRFKLQVANKKFLKTLETTFQAAKTEPRVKAMIFKAVGLLAYESQHDADLQPVVLLYVTIKPADAPIDGIPLEENDTTFNPVNTRPPRSSRARTQQHSFDPKTQMDVLFKRLAVAQSEAGMLNESLAYTSADTLAENDIVQEFYPKVLAWQDFVVEQIPWAQAEADRTSRERHVYRPEGDDSNQPALAQTQEEKLLDTLFAANGEINDALAAYHRLEQQSERKRQEDADFAMAQERSKVETRHDHQEEQREAYSEQNDQPTFDSVYLSAPMASTSSASGSSHSGASRQAQVEQPLPDEPEPKPVQSTTTSPSRGALGSRNPYARLSQEAPQSPSVTAGFLVDEPEDEPSSSNNPFLKREDSRRQMSEEAPTLTEPSAKALGKLRRMSGMPVDAEEQQRRLEEQLRQKYAQHNIAESRSRSPPPDTTREAAGPPARANGQAFTQRDILDEYDPFRA